MSHNAKIISWLIVIALATAGIAVYYFQKNTTNLPAPQTTAPTQEAAPVTTEQPAQTEEIPEEIKAIMNDNITGLVEKVSASSITIKAEDGTSKVMPMEDGKTFVISQANNVMANKKISDIKVGMQAYVHFEKETNLATTITLL